VAYEPPPTDPTFRRYPLATMHETMSLQRMREDPLARTACTLAGRLLMAMRTYDDLVCVRCEGTITRGLQMRATLLHLHSDAEDSVGFACGACGTLPPDVLETALAEKMRGDSDACRRLEE
jgi:hypothetical protein